MIPAPDSSSSKPTVEALLRLKRAERPDDAFWGEFEVRMRQKQLAASIEPKPWWLGASLLARRFSIPAMTGVAGAAGAAAVMGFMAVRSVSSFDDGDYVVAQQGVAVEAAVLTEAAGEFVAGADVQSPYTAQSPSILKEVNTAVESALGELVLAAAEALPESVGEGGSGVAGAVVADDAAAGGAVLLADTGATTGEAGSSLILTAQVKLVDDVFATLSERLEATSWTVARLASPWEDLGMLPALQTDSSVSGFAVGETDKPAPAPSSRLEQLLAMDESKPAANKSLGQVRDRVLHRFGGEEELYASASRLGVGGDRLSLRF
jgi:hypothetical protein